MAEQTLRWGILGAAKIAREKLIPAIQSSQFGRVAAVASRGFERAEQAASGIDRCRAVGGYEALLNDPEIDVIYNPLPNDLHVDWTIKALEAGKHVLCEKPLGLDSADVQRLIRAANTHTAFSVMEAFMYRFHPQWLTVKQLIESGEIGRVRVVQALFTYNNRDPDNIRNKPEAGGGALMDVGCYAISLARLVFGAEPTRVSGLMDLDERFGVDNEVSGLMEFDCGGIATFSCSTKTESEQAVYIGGEAGSITLNSPFYPRPDAPSVVCVVSNGGVTEYDHSGVDHYTCMVDAFAQSIFSGQSVPTPLSDALANMQVLDALAKSAREGEIVVL